MKHKLKRVLTDIEISPEEIAGLFANSDNVEQARFFNEAARVMKEWKTPFIFQLAELCRTKILTDDARKLMEEIGNYSKQEA